VNLTAAKMHAIMVATKGQWRTVKELAPDARGGQEDRLRKLMAQLRDLGFLHARHRARQVRDDGTNQGGPVPVEFKVRTEWGGL